MRIDEDGPTAAQLHMAAMVLASVFVLPTYVKRYDNDDMAVSRSLLMGKAFADALFRMVAGQ